MAGCRLCYPTGSRRLARNVVPSFLLALVLQCLPVGDGGEIGGPPGPNAVKREADPPVVPERILPHSLAIAAKDGVVYLGRGGRLLAFEMGKNLQPRQRASLELEGQVRDIVAEDMLVYAAVLGSGLAIVDGSDPAQIRTVGWWTLPLAEGVDVGPGRAYVTARREGLVVIDVTDPSEPSELGRHTTPEGALKVHVEGPLAYVAASYAGLRILDVGQPEQISEIGFATRGSYGQGAAWGVTVDGNRAYSAIPDNGVREVDVSDPAKAETLSIYRSLYAPVAVAVRRRYVFVADQNDGLVVLDRSGDFMQEVGRLDLNDSVTDLSISGSLAFLALKRTGFAVVDIGNPRHPRQVSRFEVKD